MKVARIEVTCIIDRVDGVIIYIGVVQGWNGEVVTFGVCAKIMGKGEKQHYK